MKKISWLMTIVGLLFISLQLSAQGPPITGDKPIMLGAKRVVLKTLTEFRTTQEGQVLSAPLMAHYLVTSDILLGIHIPFISYNFSSLTFDSKAQGLGDIQLLAKYQFYRKDGMGKTFRLVAKTLQMLPSGDKLGLDGISMGRYHGYYGIVAGYESIKYGISNELGYVMSPLDDRDELRYKLGFGLPLLKPSYPVKQVNLYFEYQSSWYFGPNEYMLLYAQGLQYAIGRFTFEGAIQLPLVQTVTFNRERKYSFFFGSRYVF